MTADYTRWLRTDQELAAFRKTEFTVENLYGALHASGGRLVLAQDTGTGKSQLIDALVASHRSSPRDYDLLIYLTSQHRVLGERPWVREGRGAGADVAVLRGRPTRLCRDLNEPWLEFEAAGCSLAGKKELCASCPRRRCCPWPDQMSNDVLRGKRVIGSVQAYLGTMPTLVAQLQERTGARSMLVVLDEAVFLDSPFLARLSYDEIRTSYRIFETAHARQGDEQDDADRCWAAFLEAHGRLLDVSFDLRALRPPFRIRAWMAAVVQQLAMEQRLRGFRFLGYEIPLLGRCRRWRSRDGTGIEYVRRPLLAKADYIIAAAGVPLELARQRLGEPGLQEFCPGVRVLHEDTRVYNLASSVGAAVHFPRNAPQILFAVAQLIANLAADGKRALVVVKKRFANQVVRLLRRYLREITGASYRVVKNPKPGDLGNPLVVPLITYGAQGINLYEQIDAAIAVSSYNARLDILVDRLNEIYPPEERVAMIFSMEAGQRVLHAQGYWRQRQGFEELARAFQHHLEAAWSEQALGRVRFAVRPRLVVFFQRTPLRYPSTEEFHSLAAFRATFGLLTRREWLASRRRLEVRRLMSAGKTCTEIAAAVGKSKRTVYRLMAALRKNDQ